MVRSVVLVVACLAATAPAAWAEDPSRPKNAAGAAGNEPAAAADPVVALASDDPAVRREAAARLGASYPDGATAAPALLELVSDPDEGVRVAARKAIGALAARGLADLATYLEGVRKPGPARDAWLAVEGEASQLGPAWTPRDLAATISDARHAKGDVAVRRETAALALCAASATWFSPGPPKSLIDVARAASRSAGAGARPIAAAAIAVLARAELVHRRFAGDPRELPAADDSKAVARIAALLDPAQKADPAVRAAFERIVPTLLTINYGHADPAFVKRLEAIPDGDSAFHARTWIDAANLAGLGRPVEAVLAGVPPLDPPHVLHSFVASVCVRRAEATKHVAAIRRDFLKSPDLRRRAVGAILILHLDPRDAEAGPALFELVGLLGKDRSGVLEGRARRELLEFVTTWIPRLPDAPIGFAEQLWTSMPKEADDTTEAAILGALVPSIRREPQLPGYLQRRYFPDEGDPKHVLKSEHASDLLAEALASAGAVGSKMVDAWVRRLAEGVKTDPVESIVALGPAHSWNCPERQLRWLAGAGSRGRVAIPAIQPLLRSPDPLERYLAAVALARIGKQ